MKQLRWISLIALTFLAACETLDSDPFETDPIQMNENLEAAFCIDKYSDLKTNTLIRFQNTSSDGDLFEWSFGDGNVSTAQKPAHTYTTPGKFEVTLTIRSGNSSENFTREIEIADENASFLLIYFNPEEKTFYRGSALTGSFETMFTAPNNPMAAFAVNEKSGLIYYHDYDNQTILRNDLNGGASTVLLENVQDVRTMELDIENETLYFAEYSLNTISAYNLTTGETQVVLQPVGNSKFGNVQDMALSNNKLFTITPVQGRESVFTGNVVSRNINQLINYQEGGHGYGIAVDARNEKIYFNSVESSGIKSANMDGTSIQPFASLDKVRVYGMDVDETHNRLIWTTWGNTLHVYDIASEKETVFNIDGANRKVKMVTLDLL